MRKKIGVVLLWTIAMGATMFLVDSEVASLLLPLFLFGMIGSIRLVDDCGCRCGESQETLSR